MGKPSSKRYVKSSLLVVFDSHMYWLVLRKIANSLYDLQFLALFGLALILKQF